MRNRNQVVLPLNLEICIPKDDPVFKMVEICEQLDYGGNMRTVGLHGTLSCISPFVEKNQSGNAVRTVGVRIYEPKILGKTDRRSMPDGYSLYVDITGRAGAGS